MQSVLILSFLWAVFAGMHIALGTEPVRGRLVARLGEEGFTYLFSAIAAISYGAAVWYYAGHRLEGPPGLGLGEVPVAGAVLVALIVLSIALMAATFVGYESSPYAVFGRETVREPRGVERITRHPFFAGLAIMMTAHALLAPHLIGAVFAAGFAILAAGGAWQQDRKLRARRGAPFERWLAVTSAVPFAAIVSGRQTPRWRELPWRTLAGGVALAVLLRAAHDGIFAWGGAVFVGATIAGAAFLTARSRGKSRRRAATPTLDVPEGGAGSWTV